MVSLGHGKRYSRVGPFAFLAGQIFHTQKLLPFAPVTFKSRLHLGRREECDNKVYIGVYLVKNTGRERMLLRFPQSAY